MNFFILELGDILILELSDCYPTDHGNDLQGLIGTLWPTYSQEYYQTSLAKSPRAYGVGDVGAAGLAGAVATATSKMP